LPSLFAVFAGVADKDIAHLTSACRVIENSAICSTDELDNGITGEVPAIQVNPILKSWNPGPNLH
ncbi:MAG: hypothetical protein QNJ58_09005, partial [Desulfobacterales bacterium]|nr:hypothetical protein [Desulfobacterales bacterium]